MWKTRFEPFKHTPQGSAIGNVVVGVYCPDTWTVWLGTTSPFGQRGLPPLGQRGRKRPLGLSRWGFENPPGSYDILRDSCKAQPPSQPTTIRCRGISSSSSFPRGIGVDPGAPGAHPYRPTLQRASRWEEVQPTRTIDRYTLGWANQGRIQVASN